MAEIVIRSIADHIPYGLTAYCDHCRPTRTIPIDLLALAVTYGEDTDLSAIIRRMVCRDCRKRLSVRLGHPEPVHLRSK